MTQRPPTSAEDPADLPIEHGYADPSIAVRVSIFSDEPALDALATRDHIIGLEVELEEARNEVARLRTLLVAIENRRSSKAIQSMERAARAAKHRLLG